jgi:quercetin dioxygenase-like cupin family protein
MTPDKKPSASPRRKAGEVPTNVAPECLAKTSVLADLVQYAPASIVSKTIIDSPAGTVTVFAFDKGQKLSEHTSPYNALVQLIDGAATITIAAKPFRLTRGQIIIMPANVPHSLTADQKFKMLLTLIRNP